MEGNEMELDPELGGALNVSNAPAENETQVEEDPLGYNPQLNCGYDPELRDDRRENKKKLRRRFEHIFEKYERDFGGIGDEIDLKTGEIIVDNGHLQSMRNEQDIGAKVSSENAQSNKEDLEQGGAVSNLELSDGNGSEDGDSEYEGTESEGEGSFVGRASNGDFSAVDANADSATSPFDADESTLEDDPANGDSEAPLTAGAALAPMPDGLTMPRPRSVSVVSRGSGTTSDSSSSDTTPTDNLLDQVPGLKESMHTLQSRYKRGQAMDQDAIQALGMSIANQLATFISRPGKDKSRRKSKNSRDSAWSFPKLPEDQERKRRRRSPSPQLEPTEPPTSGKKSIWAPIRHPRQQKRRRMKERDQVDHAEQDENGSQYDPSEDATTGQSGNRTQNGEQRKCANCNSPDSDVWRKGPDGDLCNTCGMYLYRYGLMRPNESLTEAEDLQTPEDTEGEMDPLERDWWLACASASSTKKKEIVKPVGVRNSHFVVEEDALIIQLKEIDLLSWERMTKYFQGRSAYALQCRYSKKLHGKAPEARKMLLEQGYRGTPDANGVMIFSYTREPFKEEEDELLLKLRDEDGLEWEAVAASLAGRSPEVVETRYHELAEQLLGSDIDKTEVSRSQRRASLDSSHAPTRNLRYSAEEDAKIIKLREVEKLNWAKIAENMEGRNSFSLQKRYIRELCGRHPNSILPPRKAYDLSTPVPSTTRLDGENSDLGGEADDSSAEAGSSIDAKYSAEEDALLLDLRDVQRLTWEQIDPKMPGRSRTSLIRRYTYVHGKHHHEWQPDPSFAAFEAELTANSGFVEDGNKNPDASLFNKSDNLDKGSEIAGTGTLHAEQMFTEHEDNLIVKLREIETLPWPDIAVQLRGRTVPSISQRYYHYLLPRKLQTAQSLVEESTRPKSPSPSLSTAAAQTIRKPAALKRWTTEEDDLLLTMREQGKSWVEIANGLPGRTAMAAKAHHAAMFDRTKKVYQLRQSLPSQAVSKGQTPLLRQAVNNLRRRSESAASFENEENSSMDLTRDEFPGLYGPVASSLIPNTRPPDESDSQQKTPPRVHDNASETGTKQPHKVFNGIEQIASLYPETPASQTEVVRPSSEPTPQAAAIYATPARYNPQSHPYFVTLPMPYPLPHNDNSSNSVVTHEAETLAENRPSKARASKATNTRIVSKRSKAKAMQKPRRNTKQTRRKSVHDTSDDEDLILYRSSDNESVDEDSSSDDSSESYVEDLSAQEKQKASKLTTDGSGNFESRIDEWELKVAEETDGIADDRATEKPTTDKPRGQGERLPNPNRSLPSRPGISSGSRRPLRINSKRGGPRRPRGRPPKRRDGPAEESVHQADNTTGPEPNAGTATKEDIETSETRLEGLLDTAYVNAHPEATSHHRGRGRGRARGLLPSGSSKVAAVGETGKTKKQDAADGSHESREAGDFHVVDMEGIQDGAMDRAQSQEFLAYELPHLVRDKPEDEQDASAVEIYDEANKFERPSLSNVQLVAMALRSKAPKPALTSEVYKYLEEKFEYFRQSKGWRDGIRGTLSREPQFKKASAARKAGWVLTGVPAPERAGQRSGFSKPKVLASPASAQNQSASAHTTEQQPSENAETEQDDDDSLSINALQVPTSDITKEPKSEADAGNTSDHQADVQVLQDSSEISIEINGVLCSSSPILTKKRSPVNVYGKPSTPGTGSSTLFSNTHKLRSINRSTPVKAGPFAIPRVRSVAELGNGKRIVHTPLRDFDDSEDELAL